MKVPYAKKWQKETDKLRQIALDCDLTEELKWGKPCFTFLKKNVAIVIPLKESCVFSFFKGALLKDPKHILERIGEHTQAGRWIKIHLASGDYDPTIDSEGLPLRSHQIGGVREEDRAKGTFTIPNS